MNYGTVRVEVHRGHLSLSGGLAVRLVSAAAGIKRSGMILLKVLKRRETNE